MKSYEYDGPPFDEPRSHPWSGSASDPQARYLDLRREPELIRTSLEDFRALRQYPAIEEFYALLESLNHPQSQLETSDCALSPPQVNRTAQVKAALECSGRVVLLYRDLAQNTRKTRTSWLKSALLYQLSHLDPKFTLGIIGATLLPVRYLALPEQAQLGEQLMLSFWAFGDTEASVMLNLGRVFKNLARALRGVAARIVPGD